MKLSEILDMGFEVLEVISSVTEVRELLPYESRFSLGSAEENIENYYYESETVEHVYDVATTSYEVYYKGETIAEEFTNKELVEFIKEKKYLEYVK